MKTDRYLLDTNVLLRFKNKADQDHPAAHAAVFKLIQSGATLQSCPQNMIEYRVVATRPLAANGYGLTSADAEQDIIDHERMFPILLDGVAATDIYSIWRWLVTNAGTLGKQNHDARLLAIAIAHNCNHLLTFNDRDFTRYLPLAPSVKIINPRNV